MGVQANKASIGQELPSMSVFGPMLNPDVLSPSCVDCVSRSPLPRRSSYPTQSRCALESATDRSPTVPPLPSATSSFRKTHLIAKRNEVAADLTAGNCGRAFSGCEHGAPR